MKIPNKNQSYVANKKITGYLLNEFHEIGKYKAKFFKSFGFTIDDIETFKNSLVKHAMERKVAQTINTTFGIKYELKCEINTPDKRNPCIITIWLIETGQQAPILITAYPFKQKHE